MMLDPFSLKDIQNSWTFGKPMETYYSRQDSLYLPRYQDVEHLIKAGKLFQVYGDFEASDKNARTATPRDFSALVFDLQGRLVSKIFIPVAMPAHASYAIEAAIVGQIDAEDLEKGFAEHMAAAQIHDFFGALSHFDITTLSQSAVTAKNGKALYDYPLNLADSKDIILKVQENGKKFYIGHENQEHKIYGQWLPFNGEKYDDSLLAHWSARLGFASLFPSSRKKYDMVRSDVRVRAMWVWAFGPQGSDGLQLGSRFHKKTKREVIGTRLEDIFRQNTSQANRARGVSGGITLYDGRSFDPELLHQSDYDTAATAALDFELRRIDPSGIRFLEEIDDAEKYKRFLQGNAGYSDRQPVGFIHYDQGLLTRGIGTLLATDDEFGDRKHGILYNLSHNPDDIMSLGSSELRALLVQKNNDPVFIPLELNKTPTTCDFNRAYLAGAGNTISVDEYYHRARKVANNQAFIQRVMENWYDLTTPSAPIKLSTQRQLHQDSFTHYGEPKYYLFKEGDHYQKEPKDIYKRRLQKWRTCNEFDRLLNLVTQGHAIEYSNDPEAVEAYITRYKEVSKKLAKLQENWKNPFVLPSLLPIGLSLDEARKHLWEMRESCMDARFSFYDDSWVVNERGQKLPWERVIAMPAATRKRMWAAAQRENEDAASLRIVFDRNPSTHTIITALLAFETDRFYQASGKDMKPSWWHDYFEKSWEPARQWHDAYVTNFVQGPPNLDASEHPCITEKSELKNINLILNASSGEKNESYKKIIESPLGRQRLQNHLNYKQKRIERYQWSPETMFLMGYDPETKFPRPNPRYWVDPTKIATFSVPDCFLENQSWNNLWGNHLILSAPKSVEEKEALKRLGKEDASLLLVGKSTGMMRLAAKAICFPLPLWSADCAQSSAFSLSAYSTIGEKLSKKPFLLTFEQLAPIHQTDYANEGWQHVVLPSQEWAGFTSTVAGGLPAPLETRTGILVRDLGQQYAEGSVLLRRSQGGVETGDTYEAAITSASRIPVDSLSSLSDQEAWRFGNLSATDLCSSWKRIFSDFHSSADQQLLWKIDLANPVDKNNYVYFNRSELPVALYARPARRDLFSSQSNNKKAEVQP